jgi:hypothetical protein
MWCNFVTTESKRPGRSNIKKGSAVRLFIKLPSDTFDASCEDQRNDIASNAKNCMTLLAKSAATALS